MDTTLLKNKFNQIGARIKFSRPDILRRNDSPDNLNIDVRKDKKGEYFEIRAKEEIDVMVMDVQKKDQHLLLMSRDERSRPIKFLCGHDERHWFTAAVPKGSTVIQAKQALKPRDLVEMEAVGGLRTRDAHKRHRKLKDGTKIHRQGEFMFVPEPRRTFLDEEIIKKERLSQRGKPHIADELCRGGGTTVYTNDKGTVITVTAYKHLEKIEQNRYRTATETDAVWVRGKIKHPEHATLDLQNVWHRVLVNTESRAKGARNVRFLD